MNFDDSLEFQQNQLVKARDVHEKVNDMILEFLKIGMTHMIHRQYELAYRAYNQIQEMIITKHFRNKNNILSASQLIDSYFKSQLDKGVKPDMKAVIEFNKKQMDLYMLIEDYSRQIKIALDEIGLLLKSQDEKDFDKQCSEENFGTNEELVVDKREKLLGVDVELIVKNLTPNQVSDVYSRLLTYKNFGGL